MCEVPWGPRMRSDCQWPGSPPVGRLGWSVADRHHPGGPGLLGSGGAGRDAGRAAGAQRQCQLGSAVALGVSERCWIPGFVGHLHCLSSG
jgi:hypothetical protein